MTIATQPATGTPSDTRELAGVSPPNGRCGLPGRVVTAMDGTTFASHSLTLPTVPASLDNPSRRLGLAPRTGRFVLNILGVHQAVLATAFACSGPNKFDGIACSASQGLPHLPGSAAWCATEVDYVTAGDHTVLLAQGITAEADAGSPRP